MTTLKNPQNDRLCAHLSTRKKDVVTERLRRQLASSQSASKKQLTLNQFNICRSQTQCYWGVLIVTDLADNSFYTNSCCLPDQQATAVYVSQFYWVCNLTTNRVIFKHLQQRRQQVASVCTISAHQGVQDAGDTHLRVVWQAVRQTDASNGFTSRRRLQQLVKAIWQLHALCGLYIIISHCDSWAPQCKSYWGYWCHTASFIGSNVPSLRSLVVNHQKMKPVGDFPWLWSLLRVPFSALMFLLGDREGNRLLKEPLPLIPVHA